MSLHVFCPQTGCAARVSYEAIKPTTCPRCHKAFASAFKVALPVAAPVETRAMVDDDPDDTPVLTRTALMKRRAQASTTVAKPRPGRRDDHVMNPPPPVVGPDDEDEDAGDDEDTNPTMVRRKARELAATIDPDTIHIGDQDEGVFSFKDMWRDGQSARESGATAKGATKAAKPKSRRR